ncbi:SAM-dependent methyltransferase [Streptomyces sp. BI20]|uniref:SAM-dependent methyltransferase n=1 Tax=Streptomyces sp. BI20 TaxID=3403460 RepID=UPI003C72BED0
MNRERISAIAHADHPIKAPLDDVSVRLLLDHVIRRGDERVLDLGCGTGEWLLRALVAHPGVWAEGVDVSGVSLERARQAAERLGVGERLVLHEREAAGYVSDGPFDVVLCVGSTHAFGGLLPALGAMREHVAPGGRVLVGDVFWDGVPSQEAVGLFGEVQDLAGTVERVVADGWVPLRGHVSDRRELDAYEWALWGSLGAWALERPGDPDSASALETAASRLSEWLRVYRDGFGFLSLVLGRVPGQERE